MKWQIVNKTQQNNNVAPNEAQIVHRIRRVWVSDTYDYNELCHFLK
jgi:hypothetical protein